MSSRVLVTISDGILEGYRCENDSDSGKIYFSFQGIPYATPPIGELRFKAPKPVVPWKGIKDATEDGEQCFSRHVLYKKMKIGSDDCLYLNVYTPELPNERSSTNKNKLKSVMVFIHGGAFVSGSNSKLVYGPDFLLREDVVLVVINYRIGLLGFLILEDPSLQVPGNAGLKDMVLALKWIKKNIKNFNGDPDNVTIFGESAGAASVHLLTLSSSAKGLFKKAIIQSGSALNDWAPGDRKISSEIARKLGLKDEKSLLKQLQAMDLEELHSLQEAFPDPWDISILRPVGYSVENADRNEEPFLTEEPLKLLQMGKFADVPILMGFNSREGMLIHVADKTPVHKLMPNDEQHVSYMMKLKKGSSISKEIGKKILKFYLNDKTMENCDLDDCYKLVSDTFFIRDIYRCIVFHAKFAKQPLYLYEMNLETPINLFKKMGGIEEPGVCHADDLSYLFKTPLHENIKPGSPEDLGIRRFCRLWANFAKFGNPTPIDDPLLSVTWKQFDVKEKHYLDIDEILSSKQDVIEDRIQFWEDIFSTYRNFIPKL